MHRGWGCTHHFGRLVQPRIRHAELLEAGAALLLGRRHEEQLQWLGDLALVIIQHGRLILNDLGVEDHSEALEWIRRKPRGRVTELLERHVGRVVEERAGGHGDPGHRLTLVQACLRRQPQLVVREIRSIHERRRGRTLCSMRSLHRCGRLYDRTQW